MLFEPPKKRVPLAVNITMDLRDDLSDFAKYDAMTTKTSVVERAIRQYIDGFREKDKAERAQREKERAAYLAQCERDGVMP